MKPLLYICARLKEPSTHAGIAAVCTFLAVLFPAHKDVFAAAVVMFGTIAAATPDPTSTSTEAPAPSLAADITKE